MYQNDVLTKYRNTSFDVTAKCDLRPADWLNFSYEFNYRNSHLLMKAAGTSSHLYNDSHHLTCHIVPSKTWYLTLKGEYYDNQIVKGVNKHLTMADADITYCLKGGWELNLSVTNIFDRNEYSYKTYNGVSTIYESFKIRPRNILASVFFRF
jgi:hypothetical protein